MHNAGRRRAVAREEVWKTKVGQINRGETMTMAPLVVKGKALVGNSGGLLPAETDTHAARRCRPVVG